MPRKVPAVKEGEFWLAVSRARTRARVKTVILNPDTAARKWVEDSLRQQRLVSKVIRLQQNFETDLDSDGLSDRLVAAELELASADGSVQRCAVLLAVLRRPTGGVELQLLTEDLQRFLSVRVLDVQVLAVRDLNGDTLPEVAFEVYAADYQGFELSSQVKHRFKTVLRLIHGAA